MEQEKTDEKLNWNVELEVSFFHAINEHKPIGINRHFELVFIKDKINSSGIKITMDDIYTHLNELYNINLLNENERLLFPNNEVDFELPFTDDQINLFMKKDFPRHVLDSLDSDSDSLPLSEISKSDISLKEKRQNKIEISKNGQDKKLNAKKRTRNSIAEISNSPSKKTKKMI